MPRSFPLCITLHHLLLPSVLLYAIQCPFVTHRAAGSTCSHLHTLDRLYTSAILFLNLLFYFIHHFVRFVVSSPNATSLADHSCSLLVPTHTISFSTHITQGQLATDSPRTRLWFHSTIFDRTFHLGHTAKPFRSMLRSNISRASPALSFTPFVHHVSFTNSRHLCQSSPRSGDSTKCYRP